MAGGGRWLGAGREPRIIPKDDAGNLAQVQPPTRARGAVS
jgi:hypothetical protein